MCAGPKTLIVVSTNLLPLPLVCLSGPLLVCPLTLHPFHQMKADSTLGVGGNQQINIGSNRTALLSTLRYGPPFTPLPSLDNSWQKSEKAVRILACEISHCSDDADLIGSSGQQTPG